MGSRIPPVLSWRQSMGFRQEVCKELDYVLETIQHLIIAPLPTGEKLRRLDEYFDKETRAFKALKFLDEWANSRLLDSPDIPEITV